MRSIANSSLVRRALVVSLGLAFGASAAHAGSITDTYNTGDTLTAAKMTNIRNAVNDNDTRISGVIANTQAGALKTQVDKIQGIIDNTQAGTLKTQVDKITGLETDVNNLKQNIATGSCGTGMTRVGPTCIDTNRKGPNISWIAAVQDCQNSNKRLPTAGELVAAHASGAINNLGNDTAEHIDEIGNSASGGKMLTGYIGNCLSGLGCPGSGTLQSRQDAEYDAQYSYIYYRCAR